MNFRMLAAAVTAFGCLTVSVIADVADAAPVGGKKAPFFQRVSTFNVCEQIDPTCNTDEETSAETLWYYNTNSDELKIVYTDSPGERLGFVDITDPSNPKADGILPLGGEPTTVRIVGKNDYAVVGVVTSPDFMNPSGKLSVIDLKSKTIVTEIELPGQPDAVDVSKFDDKNVDPPYYIAIAIENERDEDLGDGVPPQLPGGLLTIVDIPDDDALKDPSTWTTRDINLSNFATATAACRFPTDLEPEYVSINADNTKVVITIQENNCNLVVDLQTGEVISAIDAGSVDLENIDLTEDGIIDQSEKGSFFREPDGVSYIGATKNFATTNEGDLDGGSRGWTIYSESGDVIYDSGNELEWLTVKVGHYPDERSGNKGNEPENVLYAKISLGVDDDEDTEEFQFLFVASERSNVVFVYEVSDPTNPELIQILPVGVGPEGITFIPSKNLLAIASEVDDRGDKIRSSIALFELVPTSEGGGVEDVPEYPTLVSKPRDPSSKNGPFIPFSALSGLASACPFGVKWFEDNGGCKENILYTIEDSFYNKNRILTIDTSTFPAVITSEMRIMDSDSILTDCLQGNIGDGVDVSSIVNKDMTVNIDPEGIAVSTKGGFWIVSEGKGTVGDKSKPFETPNLLLKVTDDAKITECTMLPKDGSFPDQSRYGFEGVAEDGDRVIITIQREWGDESNPRIAVYDTSAETWKYAFYPLDEPESQNGGWVGLADIAPVGGGKFLVLERDNQAGPDAAIKKIYAIDLGDYSFEDGETVTKSLEKDLMGDLKKSNGQVFEKVEGLAVSKSGSIWFNNDNDGVDDNSGEQALLNVGTYAAPPTAAPKKKQKKKKIKEESKKKIKAKKPKKETKK